MNHPPTIALTATSQKSHLCHSANKSEKIAFALGESTLGRLLIAHSDEGICAISLGDDPILLQQALQKCFKHAELVSAQDTLAKLMAQVVQLIETPTLAPSLPLDIRGTVFQRKVWRALQRIPVGQTASYRDIAAAIDAPRAVRAVASACAANTLAVAIPCHRVVRSDGKPSGYRWGLARKTQLLEREAHG